MFFTNSSCRKGCPWGEPNLAKIKARMMRKEDECFPAITRLPLMPDSAISLSRAKATPHLVPLRMMAELRFVGDPALVCDLLPAVLALDPAANSFLVGRQGQKGRESVCARALAELSDPILQCRTAALCWTRKRRG